ncbi:MAG TPA: cytochrome c1 [Parvibaculum sp.]
MKMKMIQKIAPFAAVAALALGVAFSSAPANAEGGENPGLKHVDYSFDGPFGTYDRSQLRRGYKVYKEVCSTCHSMNLVHFRDLDEKGGPEFSEAEVKALAAGYQVQDGPNDQGDMFQRPGKPSDPFPAPYPNEEAARAALGGALPPDMSLLVKAREGGASYIYSILTGYEAAPAGAEPVPAGLHYNAAFPGNHIAMPQPLNDGQVDFDDGTPNNLDQEAKDVSAFLAWVSEPKLEERHRLGFQIMIYLLVLSGLLYTVVRKVWSDQH